MNPSLDLQSTQKQDLAFSLDQLEKETFQFVRIHRRAYIPEELLQSLEISGDFDKEELALLYEVRANEDETLTKLRAKAKHLRESLNRRQGIMKTMWDRNFLTKEITEAWVQRQFILEKQLKSVESSLGAF